MLFVRPKSPSANPTYRTIELADSSCTPVGPTYNTITEDAHGSLPVETLVVDTLPLCIPLSCMCVERRTPLSEIPRDHDGLAAYGNAADIGYRLTDVRIEAADEQ